MVAKNEVDHNMFARFKSHEISNESIHVRLNGLAMDNIICVRDKVKGS